LNDEKINGKVPIIGFNKITIDKINFTITTDKNKLL